MTSPPPPSLHAGVPTALVCPRCGASVALGERFCEVCGAILALPPDEEPPDEEPNADADALAETAAPLTSETPITMSQPVARTPGTANEPTVPMRRPCLSCGGVVGADGYCETCGTKAPSPRDHYTEQPAPWVAACCDRGIRHHRNEDATAVAADAAPGSRAVLIVCDGVSTSEDSDMASLAGARAARDLLVASQPNGLGVPESRAAAVATAFERAAEGANRAVVENTMPTSVNAAACTFSGAVLEGSLCVHANIGDSRVYWIPDIGAGEPLLLSVDDSVAQLRIDSGVPREEAESGPQAHAITKWLGRDSPDHRPTTGSLTVSGPGWLLVCSDGLWNYASEPAHLQDLIARLSGNVGTGPLPLAEALVRWSNEQGGKDNISVALARVL
jgi:serine/threonine protein phosphatase PrpC